MYKLFSFIYVFIFLYFFIFMFGSYQLETEGIVFQLNHSFEFKSQKKKPTTSLKTQPSPPHPANCPHPLGLPTHNHHQQQLPSLKSLRVKATEMTAVCQ